MKLAEGWITDLHKAPSQDSVLLACTYADNATAWFRGEAYLHRDYDTEDQHYWYWIGGQRVEPEFVPRAWMPMPFVLADPANEQ